MVFGAAPGAWLDQIRIVPSARRCTDTDGGFMGRGLNAGLAAEPPAGFSPSAGVIAGASAGLVV